MAPWRSPEATHSTHFLVGLNLLPSLADYYDGGGTDMSLQRTLRKYTVRFWYVRWSGTCSVLCATRIEQDRTR